MPNSPDAQLADFLARLGRRLELAGVDSGEAEPVALLSSLALAEACLRDLRSLDARPERPPQIAVLGPTQVGKSTLVNLLVGAEVAAVSPLAGFTVHPGVFTLAPADADQPWLADFFAGWSRCRPDELTADRLDTLALEAVAPGHGNASMLAGGMLWDTPDFDSLAARRYRRAVLEVSALADVLVLVLSREKYSDLSVWETLALLEPLERPLVIVLNKCATGSEPVVTAALRSRLEERAPTWSEASILALPLWPDGLELRERAADPAVASLRERLAGELQSLERGRRRGAVDRLLRTHWASWTAPVRAELAAREAWADAVRAAAERGLEAYRSEYLEDPHRFEGMRRAVAELLRLLEIPALAAPMTRLRVTLTWPARRVARAWRGRGGASQRSASELSNDERILQDVLDQMLIGLTRDVGRRRQEDGAAAGFWRALDRRLEDRQQALREAFHAAARAHQASLGEEIRDSARRLHERLQEHPAVLNSLRATRVGADAAAVAVAVKLGGIGINDLLLAPALVSVTSLLTEGALGSYVQHEKERLKQRHAQLVEQQVFQGIVVPALSGLSEELEGRGLLAISGGELAAMEALLAHD